MSAPELHVSTAQDGREGLVTLAGEVDADTSGLVADAVGRLIDAGVTDLAIDLALVGFIDSTGIGTLVVANNRLRSVGGKLTLFHPIPSVHKVFEITGLTNLLASDPPPQA